MLYQLSYQGIVRFIAYRIFERKAFLSYLHRMYVMNVTRLGFMAINPISQMREQEFQFGEDGQFFGKTNPGAFKRDFARRSWAFGCVWRIFRVSASPGVLDAALGAIDSVD